MTEKFRPQPENLKHNAPEAGSGPLGKSPPLSPEQQPQGEGTKSPERQPLPSVWNVLERKVKVDAPDIEDRPKYGSQDYKREAEEVNRLEMELSEKGTTREKLIVDLFYTRSSSFLS